MNSTKGWKLETKWQNWYSTVLPEYKIQETRGGISSWRETKIRRRTQSDETETFHTTTCNKTLWPFITQNKNSQLLISPDSPLGNLELLDLVEGQYITVHQRPCGWVKTQDCSSKYNHEKSLRFDSLEEKHYPPEVPPAPQSVSQANRICVMYSMAMGLHHYYRASGVCCYAVTGCPPSTPRGGRTIYLNIFPLFLSSVSLCFCPRVFISSLLWCHTSLFLHYSLVLC